MSGLLHRLVSRALDRTTAVRSDARLPFAALALRTDDAGDEPEAPATSDDTRQHVPNRSISPSPPPDALSKDTHDSKRSPIEVSTFTEATPPRPAVSAPPRHQHATASADRPRDERVPTQVLPPRGTNSRPHAPSRTLLRTGEDVDAAEAEPNRRADVSHRDDVQPHNAADIEREPSVLVPRASRSDAPGSGPIGDTAKPAQVAAKDEPSEVHVHIGRIEINAVHESTPRRPAPKSPVVAPMTLDTYLAKRGRT